MHRIQWTRALIVLTLIGSLAALPATAQAAVRVEDGEGEGSGFSLMQVVVDWVSDQVRSIWGAGGSDWDPTGHRPPPNFTPEQGAYEAPIDGGERHTAERG